MFNLDPRYTIAIQNFSEPKEEIQVQALESVVKHVADRILAATQLQPKIATMAGRAVSLQETMLLAQQDFDKKEATPAFELILNATEREKAIMVRISQILQPKFPEVTENDLKTGAVIFGIHKVKQAQEVAIEVPKSLLQQLKEGLAQLEAMKEKFPHAMIAMMKVDDQIQQLQQKIQTLEAQEQKVA